MTSALRIAALLAAALLLAGCADIDWHRTAADLAGNACRGIGSCSVVCDDGSTLDGRPPAARCRR